MVEDILYLVRPVGLGHRSGFLFRSKLTKTSSPRPRRVRQVLVSLVLYTEPSFQVLLDRRLTKSPVLPHWT